MFANNPPEQRWGETDTSFENRCRKYQLDNRSWTEIEMCQHGKDKAICPKCNKNK